MVNGISQNSPAADATPKAKVSNVIDIKAEMVARAQAAEADKAPAAQQAAADQQKMRENLETTVNQLNDMAQSIKRDLKFSVDDNSGQTVIKVVDTHSKEVIRQIPPDYVLNVRENIESLKGILFSAKI